MSRPRSLRALSAAAALVLSQVPAALGAEECRCPSSSVGGAARLMGIDYAGTRLEPLERFRGGDLTGAIKMSGTWVSKLPFERYAKTAALACRYAAQRGQDFHLQVPTTFSNREVESALSGLAAADCRPRGIAIGNEVDRLVTERIVARYSVADYVADYNRIVPVVSRRLPAAKIIALELSSFQALRYSPGDALETKYKPVFEWLVPFVSARLVRKPDYVSVHYYPFTGAQREWEALELGHSFRKILADLAPQLAKAPPLLIGEFNTTYQYEGATAYPESGGDSFMAALAVADLFADARVAGVFHWSLVEPPPSTLGLYQGKDLAPVPLLHAYHLLAPTLDYAIEPSRVTRPHIDAHAFRKDGRFRILAVNTSPFFRRSVSIGASERADIRVDAFCGCEGAAGSVTLAPFSITAIEGDVAKRGSWSQQRFAYGDRTIREGAIPRDARACATLADFSPGSFYGEHFENPRYNQNTKIATGGTFVALNSPGGTAAASVGSGALNVACQLPRSAQAWYRCGVKLPLVTDAMGDRAAGTDWSDGYDTGSLRVTLESDPPAPVELHLEDFQPEAVGFNHHQKAVSAAGKATIDVPIREFRQLPGIGTPVRPLKDVLANAGALRIEVRQAGFAGRLRVHKVEVCDAL